MISCETKGVETRTVVGTRYCGFERDRSILWAGSKARSAEVGYVLHAWRDGRYCRGTLGRMHAPRVNEASYSERYMFH